MVSMTVMTALKDIFSGSLSQNSSSPKCLIIFVSGFSEEAEKNYMHLSYLNIDTNDIY